MSRRGKSSSKKGVSNGPPPSFPSEYQKYHRKFLIRSLERNDVDLSALVKLNKSLHNSKEKILQTCGELVLLDLGSGRLKLIKDKLNEEHDSIDTSAIHDQKSHRYFLTPTQKEVCVDFLLRMKLRRKLSNRLIRRVNRVAHAMDGKDVSPPSPPKYGDLSLHIDNKSVQSRMDERKKKEKAKERIERALAGDSSTYTFIAADTDIKNTGTPSISETTGEMENTVEATTEVDAKCVDVEALESSASSKKLKDLKNAGNGLTTAKINSSAPSFSDDIDLLKEYDAAYDKCWDNSTKKFNYIVEKDNVKDLEYTQIKQCGIGDNSIIMTLEDRKSEHARWERSLLARIPQQPNLSELGLKNRVFDLEARRKRCLEDNIESNDSDNEDGQLSHLLQNVTKKLKLDKVTRVKNVCKEDNDDHNDRGTNSTDDCQDDQNLEIEDNESKEKVQNKTSLESGTLDTADNNDDEGIIIDGVGANYDNKPERSISFIPTPSFHDQDLKRICMIHKELVNASLVELIRKRFTDATNSYNKVQLLSTRFFDAHQLAERRLTFTIAKGRHDLTKAHSDYTIAYTTAKQRWVNEKNEFDKKKCDSVLPTKWGSRPYGTDKTNGFKNNADNLADITVGYTLSDIVDGCILIATGKSTLNPFKEFFPPAAPGINSETGENMAQSQHRIETELRNQCNAMNTKFKESEAERTRAWRKMMKAQVELRSLTSNNVRGNVRISKKNYAPMSLPSLSTVQSIPREMMHRAASTATYTIPQDSKYSKARINERKSADGTVAPVSEPKKTKDGLYVRPAGRTRKGMEWDAVNGVWVPQQT